jgi:hypothetical protein
MIQFAWQASIACTSMVAGLFWMASAYGNTVWPPWAPVVPVPVDQLAAHQTKWNGRAALSASIAAILQATWVLYTNVPPRL